MFFDFSQPQMRDEPQLSLLYLKKGAETTLTFDVDEELRDDPRVTLSGGGEFSKDESSTGTKYSYKYEATGDEEEGVEQEVTIEYTDEAENETRSLRSVNARYPTLTLASMTVVTSTLPSMPCSAELAMIWFISSRGLSSRWRVGFENSSERERPAMTVSVLAKATSSSSPRNFTPTPSSRAIRG